MLSRSARALASLVLVVLLAAPLSARAQTPATISVGAGTVEANAQVYYAYAMGFFKKHGLDVRIQQLRSGPTIASAVAGGDLQIGVANVLSLGAAHVRGLPFVLIAPGAYFDSAAPTTLLEVAQNSPIRTAKDLTGKTVAGISVGGLDQLAIDAWLDRNGVPISSVQFIEVPPSAMAQALEQGRIAAAAINEPELSAAGSRVRTLANAYDAIARLFMQTAWFSTRTYAQKNAAILKRFSDAVVEAGEWAEQNPERAREILDTYTKQQSSKTRIRFARTLDPALIQPVFDAAVRYKLLPKPVSAAEMVWTP